MNSLDTDLLVGFRFSCRADCGLCCYASPSVTPGERQRLIEIQPGLVWSGARDSVAARPNGGACRFLGACRCTVHSARPFPCAEFPIAVHLGVRAQATVVLSCPGLELGALEEAARGDARAPPVGLDHELAAAASALSELDARSMARVGREWTRALREVGASDRSASDERATVALHHEPIPVEYLGDLSLPSESDGLDRLPLFFDPRYGRVAIASNGDQVDLLTVRESGGVDRRLASFERPLRRPELDPEAARLLEAYRRYLLARDAFVGAAVRNALDDGESGLAEVLRDDLAETEGTVLARAVWRERLDGRSGESLSASAVAAGIAATDSDFLDRPTVGRWL